MKFAFLLFVLVGIPFAKAQSAPSGNNDLGEFVRQLASTRNTIADGYVRWTDATKARDVEAVVSLYADDALILPEDERQYRGRKQSARFIKDDMRRKTS